MRRLTKNKKYRNEKLKIKTKTRTHRKYILKGGSHLSYSETVNKYRQLFSRIDTILSASNTMKAIPLLKLNYIKKLIELLKKQTATYVKKYTYRFEDNAKENKRQLDEIIFPAIENFIKSVMDYSITRRIILLAIQAAGKTEEVLEPANIFKEKIVIPDAYTGEAYIQILYEKDPREDNSSEEQEGNMTTRRNLILAMAKDKTLIEEFINDLTIFNNGANGKPLSDSEKFELTMTLDMTLDMTANAPITANDHIDLTGGRKYRTINKLRSFRKKTRRNKKISLLI